MKRVLMKGNEAAAAAAIEAGCRFYAGYPITPQNEIPEYMSRNMPASGGVFIQAESELSAINMVYGASAAGARAMTSSSSPGISLKQEGISYLAAAELPAVIINMQRGGPGLGNISGSQADYFQAVKGGGHGDYRMLVYAPSSVQELRDLTMLAFDKADLYRTPVMVLGDGILGQMMEPVNPMPYKLPKLPRKTWALRGCGGRTPNVIKSSETSGASMSSSPGVIKSLYMDEGELEMRNTILQKKYKKMQSREVRFEAVDTEGADVVLVAFGIAARLAMSARSRFLERGMKVGLFRPITLFPFPDRAIAELARKVRKFVVVELNAGQMVQDVRLAVQGRTEVLFYGRPGGAIVTAEDLYDNLKKIV